MAIETYDSASFRECVNESTYVVPDGLPLLWAQRILGVTGGEQVRGTTLMELLCAESARKGWRVGLYGSTQEVLALLVKTLQERYRGLELSYVYSPPFRALTDEEDREVVAQIAAANVDILFVGIGCPRQERWMAEHMGRVRCALLGVGAAFDFLAGKKKEAPRWMQRTGLEWLYRLLSEPRRLWRRYLVTNTRFVWYFVFNCVKERLT
jgi:N-acetylglucosaminyldiphosphoundecaprenol N-acetyl-beta-D-mannosaminyltransferase